MDNKSFGKKVANLRKEKGLTQTQLADKLNISNKAVSRWETGEGYPEITILTSLAKELGVTVDELLNDSIEESLENKKFTNIEEEKHSYHQETPRKKHKEIPITKPYWKSLTIFNKIGYVTIKINLVCILIYIAVIIANVIFDGVPSIFFIPALLYGISVLIGRLGLAVTIIGLLAGLLDLYDRQNKASFIIAIILFVFTYILPVIMVSFGSFVV